MEVEDKKFNIMEACAVNILKRGLGELPKKKKACF